MNPLKLLAIAILVVTFQGLILYSADATVPMPTSSALPMYPARARFAHVEGRVTVWFVVDGQGNVVQAGVASGNSMLSGAALNIVRSWRFAAGDLAQDVRHQTEFNYVLGGQEKKGAPKLTVSMTDFRRVQVQSGLYVEAIE